MSHKQYDSQFISDQQICIDGATRQTRNHKAKVSKSSNEQGDARNRPKQNGKLMRQPSTGQSDYQNRKKFIQKIQDLDVVLPQSSQQSQNPKTRQNMMKLD